MEYSIPEPAESPEKSLVIFYKITKGIEYDDRLWDKKHFARNMVSAKDLIEICKDYETSKKCLEDLSGRYESVNLSWTLETIVKNAHEWMNRGKRNDKQIRERFYHALSQQRADRESKKKGTLLSAGEVLDSLGVLRVIAPGNGEENGKPNTADGNSGGSIRETPMEKEKA